MWLQFLFSSLWEKRTSLFCKTPRGKERFLFWNFYLYEGIQSRILRTVIKDKGSVFNYSNPKFYISFQISSVRSYSSLEFTFVKNTSLALLNLTSSTKLQILNFETWMSWKSRENTCSFVLTSFQLTCNKNRASASQLPKHKIPFLALAYIRIHSSKAQAQALKSGFLVQISNHGDLDVLS